MILFSIPRVSEMTFLIQFMNTVYTIANLNKCDHNLFLQSTTEFIPEIDNGPTSGVCAAEQRVI